MQDLASALSAATTPRDVALAVLRHTPSYLHAGAGAISRIVTDHLEVVFAYGLSDAAFALLDGSTLDGDLPDAHAARSGRDVWLDRGDPGGSYAPWRDAMRATGVRHWASVALCDRGQPVGALGLGSAMPWRADAGRRVLVHAAAPRCGEALARAVAYEAERHIAAVVGHDLRNPLCAIISSVELLEGLSAPLTSAQRRSLARIGSSARRMERLISDLLDYTRVQSGRGIPLVRRDTDLRELCRQVVDELAVANPGRSIALEPGGAASSSCDPDRVMQLIGNLVANALKHGAAGQPVRVRCSSGAAAAAIEVENAGPAIPDDVLRRMCEPFAQGSSRGGGIGLGLFIARAIARAHGGDIVVRSVEETTVFTVRIPCPTTSAGGGTPGGA